MEAALASLIILLAPLVFCLSLLDIALRSVQYYKISSIKKHGNARAEKLLSLLSSPERSISVLLFLRYTLTAVLYILAGVLLAMLPLPAIQKALLIPAGALLLLVLLEYTPRMLAVQNPERIAFALLRPFEILLIVNRWLPLPQALERISSRLLRLYGFSGERIFSEYSVNEIKMFLSTSRGKPESDLRKQTLETKFVDFSDRHVREVMVPRPFVKAVEVNAPLSSVVRFVQENGYSRMPVFRSTLDNVLGILHVKDILGVQDPFSLEQVLHRPYFIPESATVQSAFQNMRRNRATMAVVVDEYGGVDGIVTLEDLVEELLGEIHDEFDEEVQMLHKLAEGSWMLEGNLPLKELNQNLGLALPEDPSYTTVAGFLLSIFDKIPTEKEGVQHGNLFFTVERMVGNKISKVSLRIPQQAREHR